jgi:hypothetical protein
VKDAPSPVTAEGAVWKGLAFELERDQLGAPNLLFGPGRYVLLIQAVWANEGDVLYGFYIERR